VNTVVFDKTGTLTEGRPSVTDVIPAAGVEEQRFSGSPLQRMRGRSTHSLPPLSRLPSNVRLSSTALPFRGRPWSRRTRDRGRSHVLVGNRKLLERNGVTPGLERERRDCERKRRQHST